MADPRLRPEINADEPPSLRNADHLPSRYLTSLQAPFGERISSVLRPGMTILDVGAGRHPTLVPEQRPRGAVYIGLDAEPSELLSAPPGSYDQTVVADAATPVGDLEEVADLIVSWQVFEHVKSLDAVLQNMQRYLRPGGTMVTLFSGRWSVFAVVNRMLPQELGASIVSRVARRKAINRPVFPAFYDGCSVRPLRRLMFSWSAVEIVPLYQGAVYFSFSRPILRAYLAYENAVERARLGSLATHYLLVATR